MRRAVTMFAAAAVMLAPVEGLLPSGIGLEYRAPLGRVAEYELRLVVEGEQVSLEETRPVHLRAVVEFSEEVIARQSDGVIWLRIHGRPQVVRDPTGTFGAGRRGLWPDIQLRVTPRGEVLDSSVAVGSEPPGPSERAFSSLMLQPAPVVLAANPVQVGDEWEWADGSREQRNRLVELLEVEGGQVARIASEGRAQLRLEEGSPALGLTTRLEGEQRQTSEMDLLVEEGLVVRHRGQISLHMESETVLVVAGEEKVFPMRSDLSIDFDLRLLRVDGRPVSTSWREIDG